MRGTCSSASPKASLTKDWTRMKLRELRRQCERFTRRMLADGASPDELAGLLLGSLMRVMRNRGVSRDLYMQA